MERNGKSGDDMTPQDEEKDDGGEDENIIVTKPSNMAIRLWCFVMTKTHVPDCIFKRIYP
jgi:hypothetical protein